MQKIIFLSVLILLNIIFASCSKILGYSVLLWNIPEYGMQDGITVPVYLKSNISHVYIIGAGTSKIEVPLWQITAPESKKKVLKTSLLYSGHTGVYADAIIDGLPIRAEPQNTSKQVYRLRQKETLKILYTGEGQQVMSGKNILEGEWMRVLTSDGTQGWCFSHNLNVYKVDSSGIKTEQAEITLDTEEDENYLEQMLYLNWYPELYKKMIEDNRIDIEQLNPYYSLLLDTESKKLLFFMPKINKSWNYEGYEKNALGQYVLTNIPIVIIIHSESSITVRYTDSDGKPEDFSLVTIEEDIQQLIQKEHNRRIQEYMNIYYAGPIFKSSNYGTLVLSENGTFIWTGNRLLAPAVIPSAGKNKGTISVKYFLSGSLLKSYTGVLTFYFEGINKEVNFLYKMEPSGLKLENTGNSIIENNIIKDRSLNPLVLFFTTE